MKTTDNSHTLYKRLGLLVFGAIVVLLVAFSLYCMIGKKADTKDSSLNNSTLTQASQSTLNEDAPIATSSPIRIIALGNSLTAGYGLPLADSYPSQLESRLRSKGFNVEVINAGISGETTAGMLERVAFIRSQSADLILLGIGANDMLRFFPLETTEKNLRMILSTLTAPPNAPDLMLLKIEASENIGAAEKVAFDALYPRLAKEFNLTLVPFVTTDVFLNRSFIQEDGLHPNRDGYTRIVERYVAPAVELFLKERD